MLKSLTSFIDEPEIAGVQEFLFSLAKPDTEVAIFLRNDILRDFQKYLDNRPAYHTLSSWRFLRKLQEILHLSDRLILNYRYRKASCRIYVLSRNSINLPRLTIKEFLSIKEHLIKPDLSFDHRTMELNLAPFYDYGPHLKDPDTIGHGIKHMNRYMSGNLAQQPEKWHKTLFEFLKLHQLHGVQLLLDGKMVKNINALESTLEDVVDFLEWCECSDDMIRVKAKLHSFGFLDGWGDSRNRILETIRMLQNILEQPNENILEEFLSRIPMVSKVVMISPHGWFGQENVLGRPDTGGQVVYILDQARALEQYLIKDIRSSGLVVKPKILIVTRLIPANEGTTSDQELEKVDGTENVWIMRVPFRNESGEVMPHWISRFRLWPYLDQFAVDVEVAIGEELGDRPDLIIGNYSDGNLVATQLSKSMGVIQCNIAHALEKSKYLFSDLYWQDFEAEYNFSVQFIADLIAMNLANFIITSTSQEITGTDRSIGQYESYQFFVMPGLMQVTNGINLFHPRFNVIPPGVSNNIFFPYMEKKRRIVKQSRQLNKMLFEVEDEECYGQLLYPERPPIFSIARLDRIKNLTGLVEAYGADAELREQANLILVTSVLDPAYAQDAEEVVEIRKMHQLIAQYNLAGHIRWLGKRLSKEDTGEVYRIMADRKGVFIQPALFEAFGLTILEAMHSGLPVFATQFGGPLEIIERGQSGFLINPTDHAAMTGKIAEFFIRCQEDDKYWDKFSRNGMKRAQSHFTWDLHCQRLTRLTKVYGFWRYSISEAAKSRLAQYSHLLYYLFFKERAKKIK